MPGLFTGFSPSSALEGLKRAGSSIYDWAVGAETPQPYREPTIGPNTPSGITQMRLGEVGWDPEHYQDPSTNPLSRVVGAVRDVANKTVGTPAGQALQAITMFKTPEGGIDMAARQAATQRFIEAGRGLGAAHEAGSAEFASRWPRVAAHSELYPAENIPAPPGMPPERVVTKAFVKTPRGPVTEPVPMGITPAGIKEGEFGGPREGFRQIKHEGTHVAQALGNPEFKNLYHLASEITGYKGIPFEVIARESQGTPVYPYKNAIDGLHQIADEVIGNPQHYSPKQQFNATQIKAILQRRADMPMAPTTSEWAQEPR